MAPSPVPKSGTGKNQIRTRREGSQRASCSSQSGFRNYQFRLGLTSPQVGLSSYLCWQYFTIFSFRSFARTCPAPPRQPGGEGTHSRQALLAPDLRRFPLNFSAAVFRLGRNGEGTETRNVSPRQGRIQRCATTGDHWLRGPRCDHAQPCFLSTTHEVHGCR